MVNGIKFYRLELKNKGVKDWSQQALADYVGVPRTRISFLENGQALPTPWELKKIAEFLKVTPGHIYTPKQIEAIYEVAHEKEKEGRNCQSKE